VTEDKDRLIAETGDVLYHLLVMLTARGITLDEIMAELERRTHEGGLAEKAKRKPI
jgi:phosphoribosyl-ATP pyrophosphohydrolase